MAFDNSYTAVTGGTLSAAEWNTSVKDNFTAVWVGTLAGDMDYYTAATTKARLAIGAQGSILRSSGSAPAWLAKGSNARMYLRAGATTPLYDYPRLMVCSVYNSGNIVIPSQLAPFTEMTYDSELTDSEGWHSTSSNTGRVTPNIAGNYIAWVTPEFVSSTNWQINIFKNGFAGTALVANDGIRTYGPTLQTDLVAMNGTTDYFNVGVIQNSGGNINAVTPSFNVALVESS